MASITAKDNVLSPFLDKAKYWAEKVYDTFRYDIPYFFGNIWKFRKELYNFRTWDSTYNLGLFAKSLELTVVAIENGHEEEVSRDKKVKKMRRAILLMKNFTEGNFLEQAEEIVGTKMITKMRFEPKENEPHLYEVFFDETSEEEESNREISKKSIEIEEEQWKELWQIIEGQRDEDYIKPETEDWEELQRHFSDWQDGSGMRGWWE